MTDNTQPQTWHFEKVTREDQTTALVAVNESHRNRDYVVDLPVSIIDAIIADHAAAAKLTAAEAKAQRYRRALETDNRRLQGIANVVDAEALSGEELFTKLGDLIHNALVANRATLSDSRLQPYLKQTGATHDQQTG